MSHWHWALGGAAFVAFAGLTVMGYQRLLAVGGDPRDVVGFGLSLVCAIAVVAVGIFAEVMSDG